MKNNDQILRPPFTQKQRELEADMGTPPQYAADCYESVYHGKITLREAADKIDAFNRKWIEAAGNENWPLSKPSAPMPLSSARGSAASSAWTKTPPDRDGQGYWWWWNGDDDAAPNIVTVMYSGCSGKCFVCLTDDPETRDVDSERWSGWWKRIPDEMPPNVRVSESGGERH